MNGCYQYDILRKKYKNFTDPAIKVKIGSTSILAQKEIALVMAEVTLSLTTAGSAYFVFAGAYDQDRHQLLGKFKNQLKLGKIVQVELGYGSSTKLVFKGYLASVNYQFSAESGISAAVTALDARRLMMTDNRPYLQYEDSNYSDIVKKIMKRYGKLCTLSCDATVDKLKEPVTQRVSDYDFIVRELIGTGKTDREFFIVGEKAYFRKPHSNQMALITLGMDMGLSAYSRTTDYMSRKIEVQGYNPKQDSVVRGTAKASCLGNKEKVISSGVTVLVDSQCKKESVARSMAQTIADQLRWGTCRSEGACVGLPEMIPGRFLKIKEMDAELNRKYYITKVTHKIDEDGFTTEFETEGWIP